MRWPCLRSSYILPTAGVHNNLFTNINTGAGTRPWQSGGDAARGADTGA